MTIAAFLILLAEKPELQRDFASSEERARRLMLDLGLTHEQQDLILGLDHEDGHRKVTGTQALEDAIARELGETRRELPDGTMLAAPLCIYRPPSVERP